MRLHNAPHGSRVFLKSPTNRPPTWSNLCYIYQFMTNNNQVGVNASQYFIIYFALFKIFFVFLPYFILKKNICSVTEIYLLRSYFYWWQAKPYLVAYLLTHLSFYQLKCLFIYLIACLLAWFRLAPFLPYLLAYLLTYLSLNPFITLCLLSSRHWMEISSDEEEYDPRGHRDGNLYL